MSNPLPRKVLVAVGLCALLVLLFSCAAAVRDEGSGGDCRDLGLTAVEASRTARPAAPPAPLLSKAPARTARPSSTPAPARPHHHGHGGGLDVDLTVCP
ncbi:hypothetical protein [Streptomyces tendae]|uniref:hypothetical protein n=1 Tax=Streptomyces tendae TaxID=1932 RepID=UPI00343AD9BB